MLYKTTPPAEYNLVKLLHVLGDEAIHRSLDLSPQLHRAANDNPRTAIMMSLLQNSNDYTMPASQEPTTLNTYDRTNMFASNLSLTKPLHTPTVAPKTTQKMSIFRVNKDATGSQETRVVPLHTAKVVNLRGEPIQFRA